MSNLAKKIDTLGRHIEFAKNLESEMARLEAKFNQIRDSIPKGDAQLAKTDLINFLARFRLFKELKPS